MAVNLRDSGQNHSLVGGKPSLASGSVLSPSSSFCSVQSLSHVRLFVISGTAALPVPCPSPKPGVAQTQVPQAGDAIQSSHSLLSPSPPAFNLSQHQGPFKWVSSSHHVTKGLSFSLSISPYNEYSRLISFRIDWFDLLAVQGTLKSLLQHVNRVQQSNVNLT